MQIGKTEKKFRKKLSFLRQMHLNILHSLVSTNKGILVIRSQCVKKRSEETHVSKSDFSDSITFTVITQDDKSALIKIESVFLLVYHVAYREVLWNWSF